MLPREEFVLGYTHSVMKTPVEERYRADPRLGLVMVETLYHSYGVGLPFLPEDGELTVDERGMVLRMDRVIGSLNMTISGIGEHWLEVEGRRWELAELLDGGGSITLSAQTLRCWRFSPASEPVLKTS